MALYGVLTTPSAIIDAFRLSKANHWFIGVMILAFTIRFGMIALFFSLWLKYAPAKAGAGHLDNTAEANENR
jgi:fluoride ion exporter CrcB/FEX